MCSRSVELYCSLLRQWNRSINLVQHDTLDIMLERHIADSLQIRAMIPDNSHIIDIGSGAGFPGVVLSIYGVDNIVLCEKSVKKATFLRMAKHKLHLSYDIFNNDIYNFDKGGYVSVSRAFGSIAKLCDVMLAIKSNYGVFLKGETYKQELECALQIYDFDCDIKTSITNAKSAVVVLKDVRRKNGVDHIHC